MLILTTLSGFPCMVPVARLVVRNALHGCPRRSDAEQLVSEFTTNAVRHSLSRGGQFELWLEIGPGRLRIEVRDGGPFGYPPPKPPAAPVSRMHPWITLFNEDHQRNRAAEIEEYGLSLALINAFSDKWGTSRYPAYACWWAELTWLDFDQTSTIQTEKPNRALPERRHQAEASDTWLTPIDTPSSIAQAKAES